MRVYKDNYETKIEAGDVIVYASSYGRLVVAKVVKQHPSGWYGHPVDQAEGGSIHKLGENCIILRKLNGYLSEEFSSILG